MSLEKQPAPEPFSKFMERALYDPENGYYTTGVRAIGRGGDFTTTPVLGDDLARAIARWADRESTAKAPAIRHIIEVGAGGGHLMQSLRRSLGLRGRWLKGWRLHIVDRSPALVRQQQERLGMRAARWHEGMAPALRACGGRALIICNELPDAFPATLLQWDARRGAWDEIWVAAGQEQRHPFDPGRASGCSAVGAWDKAHPPPHPQQRVELGLAYKSWLGGWLPELKGGALLTIDYGDTFPHLYHRRPRGTLRAYFHQQRLEGAQCYARPGKQALTCDVNFTDLQRWGESAGLETVSLTTQAGFLQNFGPARARRPPGDAAAFLAAPDGAGDAFKILHQRCRGA